MVVSNGSVKSPALAIVEPPALDRAKLDEVTRRINEASRRATFDLALEVGEIIVRELYEGNLALWGQHGTRCMSYKELAARSDLLMSPSALCRAVGIFALCERHGGRARWPNLSLSHLQEVLALEPAQQQLFLGAAQTERWTVSRLRAEIAKQRPRDRRGRRRSLAKTVRELKVFLSDRRSCLFDARGFSRLDDVTARELGQAIGLLRDDLERLEKLLKEALAGDACPDGALAGEAHPQEAMR